MAKAGLQEVEERHSTAGAKGWVLSFGELDALLASVHDIGSAKRAAFQGRLKHFLKLGALPNVKQGRGRAAAYAAGDVLTMSMLCELSRWEIAPESALAVMRADMFPIYAAIHRSVDQVATPAADRREGFVDPVMIYYNPNAFEALSDDRQQGALLWSGGRHLAGHLVKVTSAVSHRSISILNVTAALDRLIYFMPQGEAAAFLGAAAEWAAEGMLAQPDRSAFGPWEQQ